MTRKGWILLVALGVIWGIPYLLIQVAVRDYSPVIVAFGRAVMGALILLPFAIGNGSFRSGFRNFGWLTAYTIAEISGPWILIGYAERHVASSTAGLIIALTPIFAAVLGAVSSGHRLSSLQASGLALGLLGVGGLLGFDASESHWLAMAALVLSALGYAVGPLIIDRRLSAEDTLGVVVASLFLAALFYAPAVPSHWPGQFSLTATLAIAALSALCTAVAFVLLFALIGEVGAYRATIVGYINPAVAVLLGVSVLGEPMSLGMLVSFALIVTGTFLATGRKRDSDHSTSSSGGARESVLPATLLESGDAR